MTLVERLVAIALTPLWLSCSGGFVVGAAAGLVAATIESRLRSV